MTDPSTLLKEIPSITPNPNLPRDVLGMIFSEYRANLERDLRDAPVRVNNRTITNSMAIRVLAEISVIQCREPNCEEFIILTVNWRDMCDEENDKRGRYCSTCDNWFCNKHIYMIEDITGDEWPTDTCSGCHKCKCTQLIPGMNKYNCTCPK